MFSDVSVTRLFDALHSGRRTDAQRHLFPREAVNKTQSENQPDICIVDPADLFSETRCLHRFPNMRIAPFGKRLLVERFQLLELCFFRQQGQRITFNRAADAGGCSDRGLYGKTGPLPFFRIWT